MRLDTANAMRAGMFALITPVMTLTDGRCVATIRWMPTARAFWAMRVIDSSTSRAATIIRSFSSSTTTTMYGRCSYSVSGAEHHPGRRDDLALGDGLVVSADVAEAHFGQEVVPPLHLLDRPTECVGRLLRVGHRLREQVREPLVLAHLDLLGVDQDQAHVVGRGAHQQRRDDAVDAARLTGARGAGDQQVRRGGEVEEHRFAGDVLTDRHLERVGRLDRFGRRQQVAECHELTLAVRDLDADRRAAGDRSEDAHVGGRHRVRDVLLQARDASDLDARAELELVPRDRRADGHPDERGLDTVRRQRLLEHPSPGLDLLAVDGLLARAVEERHRRQDPLPDPGTVG